MIFLLVLAFGSSPARAAEAGCEIREWSNRRGEATYYRVSSEGRVVFWRRQPEVSKHSNEGSQEGIRTWESSEAYRACARRGFELPAFEDFEALRSCFEREASDSRVLSERGLREFHELFPSMTRDWYWSVSVYPGNPSYAFLFSGKMGMMDGLPGRYPGRVVCVVRPKTNDQGSSP
jgi:hypothetical protein